ncbi:YgeY family selenium metabolism-linked hydrolase [Paenibacillus sp. PR3]|uniref:YgeY family selenium metabolism-linked hydrolase n=1 Tax=Paenibacillus terricola TaxID=2763503 RepID=A0ABR8MTE9_9BACL|nr:YgeY family selenium metabolism-linked hydrolase [Paenibacillus terricola]MBD3919242.1 YgeY family selenium metabolism-linked hydrolase [Paenibacillus terricola]
MNTQSEVNRQPKVNREELIALTQRLIRAKSLSGEEQEAACIIRETMLELGYDEVWIDAYGSVIGKVQGSGGGASVLFDGHIDTVPINSPEKWTHDPFGGEIVDGIMYGRGTSDMKASVAAAVLAVGEIAREARRTGNRPKGDLYVSGTVFEEVFEGVALGKVLETIKPDLVVIMEATGLKLNVGQRGRAEVSIVAHGRSAHSSNPDVGINAVYAMNPVIDALTTMEPTEQAALGRGISVVTDIISSPYPGASVVPDRCEITIDRRLLVGEDSSFVKSQYESLLPAEGTYEVKIAKAELECYTGAVLGGERFFPAWLADEGDPWVEQTLQALRGIGQDPSIGVYSFCTNGSCSAGTAGIPTIGYGPSYEHVAHIVDEYIELDQLEQAAEGYYAIAAHIAGQ